MSENAIPIAEAARDFLRILERVESHREAATLLRDGQPIAKIVPWPQPAATCEELAERWEKMQKLPPEEAELFARDLEYAHASLPPLRPAWD